MTAGLHLASGFGLGPEGGPPSARLFTRLLPLTSTVTAPDLETAIAMPIVRVTSASQPFALATSIEGNLATSIEAVDLALGVGGGMGFGSPREVLRPRGLVPASSRTTAVV